MLYGMLLVVAPVLLLIATVLILAFPIEVYWRACQISQGRLDELWRQTAIDALVSFWKMKQNAAEQLLETLQIPPDRFQSEDDYVLEVIQQSLSLHRTKRKL